MPRGMRTQILEGVDVLLDSAQLATLLPRVFNYFKGKSAARNQQVAELVNQGVQEENIGSFSASMGDADEMRLLSEMCYMINKKHITAEEGNSFFSFLKNGEIGIRRRFRDAYITETNRDKRLDVLAVMSKLNNEQRENFLAGPGLTDPTLREELVQAIGHPLKHLSNIAAEHLPALEARKAQRDAERKKTAPKNLSWWGKMWRLRIFS